MSEVQKRISPGPSDRGDFAAATASPRERVLHSDFGRMRIEYVGGHRPYLWIADSEGKFIDAIEVKALREFLKGRRS